MSILKGILRFLIGLIVTSLIAIGFAAWATWSQFHEMYRPALIFYFFLGESVFLCVVFIFYPALKRYFLRDVHLKWIYDFWQPHMAWLWVLIALTILSSGVALAFPLVFRYVIDFLENSLAKATPEAANTVIWKAIWIFVIIGIGRTITSLFPGFRALLNSKIAMDVRQHYFCLIITKGHKFFQKLRTGDLVTRLTDDIDSFGKIAWFSCSGIFRALESSSKFVFCISFMLFLNWKLTLLVITPLPIILTLFYFVRMAITKAALANQQVISDTNDALESAFSGVRIVKAFRSETNQTVEFRKLLDRRIETEMRLRKLWIGLMNLYGWVQNLGQVIVLIAGGIMVVHGTLSIGVLYAFYIYLQLLMQPLMDIPQLFVTSRQAFACIDRENEIENTPGGTEDRLKGTLAIDKLKLIELKNVDFKFEADSPLSLSGINLTIKRGEKAAVVGSVGSGKSTLIKIAAGLIQPSEGEVYINDKPIMDYEINGLRKKFGYIPQESTLFSETVAENVRFGREIGESEVREALDMAQVLGEMEKLPKGLEEVLGQKGLTVSGGQKQRLAIARALAGKPDILLMDDCTSALDAENERRFWQMFAEKSPDASCLIVTHRLATARQADVIYVLDEGKIVGKGTHAELLRSCEEYQNFLTREELQAALAG
ncbi:MAG: ABC transporter ATP-binding protein [bacterium]|nr:ABC transporter ATP-binding protein [bacterium]